MGFGQAVVQVVCQAVAEFEQPAPPPGQRPAFESSVNRRFLAAEHPGYAPGSQVCRVVEILNGLGTHQLAGNIQPVAVGEKRRSAALD